MNEKDGRIDYKILGNPPKSLYRPEIDGLRALAVLPVVLFHAGVQGLGGGFVGVDVFFVISGYLITTILYREAGSGEFSIVNFYKRRIRRIMPNLLAMLIVVTFAAGFILIPTDYSALSKSVVSTLLFVANIWFYKHLGYFSSNSQQAPLLHMWSLGVEEQYYLFFPVLLLCIVGYRRSSQKFILFAILAISFGLSAYQAEKYPNAAFYLPFSRLWELMVGSVLAIGAIPTINSRIGREMLAITGIGAIVMAIVSYSDLTPFPGVAALLPCLGAAAFIHSNSTQNTSAGKLFSARPFVTIGLVSYSLYIWHWPIIALTRYALQREPAAGEKYFMLAMICIVSVSAWHWIEKPMRSKSVTMSTLLRVTASVGGGLTIAVAVILLTHGLPQRYDERGRRLALADLDINPDRARCDHPSIARIINGDVCHAGPPGQPRFVMIGDSFGDAMSPAVYKAANDAHVPGMILTFSGCAPLPDVDEKAGNCRKQMDAAYQLISRERSLRKLLIIGRWPTMITGSRYGLFKQNHILLADAESRDMSPEENRHAMARGFSRALKAFPQGEMVVVTGMPEQLVDVPQAAALASHFNVPLTGITRDQFENRQRVVLPVLKEAAEISHGQFHVLDLSDAMCGVEFCPIVEDGVGLYADDNHPSASYALKLSGNFFPIVESINQIHQ